MTVPTITRCVRRVCHTPTYYFCPAVCCRCLSWNSHTHSCAHTLDNPGAGRVGGRKLICLVWERRAVTERQWVCAGERERPESGRKLVQGEILRTGLNEVLQSRRWVPRGSRGALPSFGVKPDRVRESELECDQMGWGRKLRGRGAEAAGDMGTGGLGGVVVAGMPSFSFSFFLRLCALAPFSLSTPWSAVHH